MTIKYSYEEVFNYFHLNDCELLENVYMNNYTKMKYKCKCGNVSNITFWDFKCGKRCGCKNRERAKFKRHSIEFIQNLFKENGCELLEKEYKNNKQLLEYKCNCGKISKICLSSFKIGRRCKECGLKKLRRPSSAFNCKIKKKYISILRTVLFSTGKRKTSRSKMMLGYGVEELKNRLINHPNWEKIKDLNWHIDHIFPIKAFIEYGILDIKIVNSLDNLQPLSAKDNMEKRDKYNEVEFIEWLKGKGIMI